MKKKMLFVLSMFIMLQFTIIFNLTHLSLFNNNLSSFIPQKTNKKLYSSIGPVFEEGADGFAVNEGEIWNLIVKKSDPNIMEYNIGDIIRINITTTNNSLVMGTWMADTLFGKYDYYNITDHSWSNNLEAFFSGYNSTVPFPSTDYYYYPYNFYVIPLNYSASNHTLVDMVASFLTGSFSHSEPTPPNINGTWSMWNGTATTPGSQKYTFTFNDMGILMDNKFYLNGTTDWLLVYEVELDALSFVSPKNVSYFYNEVPIIVQNSTYIDKAWFRYNSGAGWVGNYSLNYDGANFKNESIYFNEGTHQIQVFGNSFANYIFMIEEWFSVDTDLPWNISLSSVDDLIPRIALDSLGKAHVVWFGYESGSYEIYYDTNKDGHFGNKIQITNTTNNTLPDIGIDASNIVHIVWMDGNNSDIKYTNNTGGTFNTPVSISKSSLMNVYPRIAVDVNGFAHIIWSSIDESGDVELYYTNNTAGSFGIPENVTLNNVDDNYYSCIDVDNNGITHLLYSNDITGNDEIYYKNNSLGDFTMDPINISRNTADDYSSDIAIDSTGKVHITWSSYLTGEWEIFYINNTMNDFTSTPLNISRDSNWGDYYPIIALDNSTTPNSVVICWEKDLIYPDSEIYTSNNYLGSFNSPQNISQSPDMDMYPYIAVDAIKKLAHFAWMAVGGDADILYNYYNYYNPLNLLFPTNSVYHYCQLVPIIVQNTSYIDKAWFRYDSGDGWSGNYSLTYNGTYFINNSINWDGGNYRIQIFGNNSQSAIFMIEEWFNINASLPWYISLNSADDYLPRLALDSLGNVHIVWFGSESGAYEIYYDTNKNGYFGNKTQITNTTNNTYADIGIDSSNIVHIVWTDGNNSDIKYTNNTGGTFNTPVSISRISLMNIFPRIAVEDNGFVHIIWFSIDESGDVEIYYVNNTSGSFGTPENVTQNNVDDYAPGAIAVDNGIVHILYSNYFLGNEEIYYKNNSLGDFSMDPVNISRNDGDDYGYDIAIDSSGYAHITWSSHVAGDDFEVFYINNTMNDFSSDPLNISRDFNNYDEWPVISLDKSTTPNSVFISWEKEITLSEYDIYTSNNYLGNFNSPQDISQSPNDDSISDIAIDPINKLAHFVWMNEEGDEDILYYYYNYFPILNLISPINSVYYYHEVPIIVQNSTYIDKAWFRYDSGGGWSANFSLIYTGTNFINNSVTWDEKNYHIQIFGNNSDNHIFMTEEWFSIDTSLPWNISLNFDQDGYARMALDSLGNVHIVWFGNESGANEIYYDTNKDGHFGNKIQITNTTNNTLPDIGIDASNIVHIVWMDGDNFDIKYTNNTGGQFNPPVSISTNSPVNEIPRIAVEDNGVVHIVWSSMEGPSETEIYYINNSAGSFGTPENVTLNNINDSGLAAIAVDNNSIAHIIYTSYPLFSGEVYYKNNSLGDFSMNPVNISRNNSDDWGTDIAIDSAGNVHITWESARTGDYEIYYINNTMNDFTSVPLDISQDLSSDDYFPTIALDKSTTPNSVFISWYKWAGFIEEEIFTSNNYLGSFSSPQNISQKSNDDFYSDIAIDSINKKAHIVWTGVGSDYEVYYYYYTYQNPLKIIFPTNSVYYYPEVPIIVQNSTYIDKAWFRIDSGTGWTGNYSLTYNGTYFTNDSIIWDDGNYRIQIFGNNSDSEIYWIEEWFIIAADYPLNLSLNTDDDTLPRMALDSLGNAHIVWCGNETGSYQIYYTTNMDGHFGNKIQITNTGNNIFPDIEIDSSNIVHIVWADMNNLDIKYSNNTGGAFNPPISISVNSFSDDYPRIAVEDNGFVHILWYSMDEMGDYEIYYVNNTSGLFGTPENVSLNNVDDGSIVAIEVDSNGIAHIIYTSLYMGNYEVYYKNNSLGDFSMTPVNISRSPVDDCGMDIEIDSIGNVHITWESLIGGYYEVFYINNTMNDFTSTPQNISQDSTHNDQYAMLSLDNSTIPNSVFICWMKNVGPTDWEIYTINNYMGGFKFPQNISQSKNNDYFADIEVDPINKIAHVVWAGNGSDFDILYNIYDYEPLELISPTNSSYNYNNFPIILQNSSYIDRMWFRNNTGAGWSDNTTLMGNGTHFVNSSLLIWNDGSYRLQVFGNNSFNKIFMVEEWFIIDTNPPTGIQDPITSNPQNNDVSGRIWVNGTASDATSGIISVIIQSNNVTGGSSWSANQGNETNWCFYNTSYIPDNNVGEVYAITINITDNVGNWNLINCYIIIDNTPPSGSQDVLTAQPQKNDISGNIWVNGTSFDLGSGIASVIVQNNNVTGGASWSINQGTGTNWAFSNTSFIPDNNAGETYEIIVNITDNAGNSNLINCYIIVDNTPPSGSQDALTALPQKNDISGYIWINGTASDITSGITSVVVQSHNVTGGTWSVNQGTGANWAFSNSSYIPDNNAGEVYEITVNITDNAGNSNLINCYILIDNTPPSNVTNLINLDISSSDNIVELNWTRSTDINNVRYEIWRRRTPNVTWQLIYTTAFNVYQYNDSGLPNGNYEYKIRPIDEAGNYGNDSDIIIVQINMKEKEAPIFPPLLPEQDNLLLIIIIIGIAVGAIVAIVIALKRKAPPEKVIEPKKSIKKEMAPSLYDSLVKQKKETEEGIPAPLKEEKPMLEKVTEVKEFYYYCAKCNVYYKIKQKGRFSCPTCQNVLEEYTP